MQQQNDFMIKNKVTILISVFLAMFLSALDQTIVATATPQIIKDLQCMALLSWIFIAYMLTTTVSAPIFGKLSDLFGRRIIYVCGIGIFLVGSALCGLSSSMLQLIIFRALQGIGGGAMIVSAMGTIGDFPSETRSKWQGFIGGIYGLANIVGPFLGGWISDAFSWRWIFYVNLPLGIPVMFLLWKMMPKNQHQRRDKSIDFLGATLLVLGLIPFLLTFIWGGTEYAWNSQETIFLSLTGLITLILFIFVEKRASDPIISLSLFKNKVFLTSCGAMFFIWMGMFGAILYLPIFAQSVIGISATHSGIILAPMMIASFLGSTLSGQIISRTGRYKGLAIFGVTCILIGYLLFSFININTTQTTLSMLVIFLGIGMGITMPLFMIVIQSAFERKRIGEVTATFQLIRSMGATIGTAIMGGVMNNRLAHHLAGIANDPFILAAKQLGNNKTLENITSSSVRNLLNNASQKQMQACISQAPENMQDQLQNCFNQFITIIKEAFSNSVGFVFLVSCIFLLIALIIVLFLPTITLRKHKKQPILEEAGKEMATSLGQSDKRHEPEL
ncbi:MAG: Drug resistance transporter, EmrB/QacA subfamily [candidate division TM6 bacterium GW2011_GWF2_32_72]|nr:MAG: Drug resistance transporter, EmrB/QacA subfamily [candidate division TM6 bacterium GW2011_GWF2_32_72]